MTRAEQMLASAKPDGPVTLDLTSLRARDRAISAPFLRDWLLGRNDESANPVTLRGARFGGVLELAYARISFPVVFEHCEFHGGLLGEAGAFAALVLLECTIRQTSAGVRTRIPQAAADVEAAIDLSYARISGPLTVRASHVFAPHRLAIVLSGAEVRGGVVFEHLSAHGTVEMFGARVSPRLVASHASVEASPRSSFALDRIEVDGPALFKHATCDGPVRLVGAHITGPLDFEKAAISDRRRHSSDRPEPSLMLGHARLDGGLRCAGATLDGAIDAWAVTIGSRVVLDGATVERAAFVAARLSGDVHAKAATIAQGLLLAQCDVGGTIDLRGTPLRVPEGIALNCAGTSTRGDLLLDLDRIEGLVDLRAGELAGTLDDRMSADMCRFQHGTNASPVTLRAQGFRFARFADDGWGLDDRRCWLRLSHPFDPGVYDVVAAAYRGSGRFEEARRIGIEREVQATRAGAKTTGVQGGARTVWRYLQEWLTLYGYQPARTLWLSLAIIVVAAFLLRASTGVRFESKDSSTASGAVATTKASVEGYPGALLYSADAFLPLVDLGGRDRWQPRRESARTRLLVWNIGLQALGWLLTTIFVTGFTTAVVRRRDG